MASLESIIDIQKDRAKLLLNELVKITNYEEDIDVIIDVMTENKTTQRAFEIYAGLYEAYMTISTYSLYIGQKEEADHYEGMAKTTADAWEKVKALGI